MRINLENDRISPRQFMFAIACFVQASSLLIAFFLPLTQQDSWINVVAAYLIMLPVIIIYLRLMRLYPQKSLVQIHEAVYGRVAGTIISLLYIWFFLSLTSLNLLDFGDLLKMTMMIDTPAVVLTSLCIIVCAYAIYHGLRVVIRYSLVFVILAFFVLLAGLLLTLDLWHMENFLPVFNEPFANYVQGTHLASTIPFGEAVVFLMIAPCVRREKKGMARYYIGGLSIGALTVLGGTVVCTAVLGQTLSLYVMPPFELMRMITVTEGITRVELLIIVIQIILLFFKVLMLYYVSVLSVAQLFKLKSYHPIVLTVGALIVVYAILIYPNAMVHLASAREQTSTLWTLYVLILPVTTLVFALIRRKKAAKKEAA